jgi:type IV fimbrial biogenesis protein FimT
MLFKSEKGLTIIELMVVLSIISIGAVIAAPNISSMTVKSELDSGARNILILLAQAKSEAITRNTQVSLVPAGGNWASDLTMITDDNGNGVQDGNDEVIAVSPATINKNISITNNDGMFTNWIGYLPNGFGVASGGSGGGQFQVCSTFENISSRVIQVSPVGRTSLASNGPC